MSIFSLNFYKIDLCWIKTLGLFSPTMCYAEKQLSPLKILFHDENCFSINNLQIVTFYYVYTGRMET